MSVTLIAKSEKMKIFGNFIHSFIQKGGVEYANSLKTAQKYYSNQNQDFKGIVNLFSYEKRDLISP